MNLGLKVAERLLSSEAVVSRDGPRVSSVADVSRGSEAYRGIGKRSLPYQGERKLKFLQWLSPRYGKLRLPTR